MCEYTLLMHSEGLIFKLPATCSTKSGWCPVAHVRIEQLIIQRFHSNQDSIMCPAPPACPTLHIISRSENVLCCALHVKNGQLWTPSKPKSHPSPGVHAWKLIQAWLIHILVITLNYFAVVQVVIACQDMLQEVSKGREEEGRWARCNHTPVVV